MTTRSPIDYDRLLKTILAQYQCDPESIHGIGHWRKVERIGLLLAKNSAADIEVVRLFAFFHDACRWNDGGDPQHGPRGAALARELQHDLLRLSDEQLDALCVACEQHTWGQLATDPTIGACWDADRLDLGRVGIYPHPDFMSTERGKRAASAGNLSVLEPDSAD